MKIFVVNCGSSSVKYQLFDMSNESVLAKGLLERIGGSDSALHHTVNGLRYDREFPCPSHTAGLNTIINTLVDPQIGVVKNISEIEGVGHRVLHGGEKITHPCLIDDGVKQVIKDNFVLGPLHNPANLSGIEAAMAAMPGVPNVAVFDTAFFATLPPKAYRYAVPNEWYSKHHVRRYGFHGTSHRNDTLTTAPAMGKPLDKTNLITVHLGNGCSITAIHNGKAVDHSMGLTPLEGLVMGTRSGDIDPAVVFYMVSRGMAAADVDKALNKSSGLLGLSGQSNDMRDLLVAAEGGNKMAELAIEVFVYRVLKYIGAYYVVLPSLDAIVLTGGIGENSIPVRRMLTTGLIRLGAVPDEQRNRQTIGGKTGPITADASPTSVWVISTNEELMIARDTMAIVG
jgi:acetate kinase